MWAFVSILLAGLAVRVLALHEVAQHPCFALPDLAPDAGLYHRLALRMARGEVVPADAGNSSVVWTQVLGAAYRLFGAGPYVGRLVNVAIGTATIGVLGAAAARLLHSRAAALCAATGAALFAPFVYFDTSPLKVSLGILLAALALLLAAQPRTRRSPGRQLVLGLVLALGLDLNRLLAPPALLLLAAMLLPAIRGRAASDGAPVAPRVRALVAAGRVAAALVATLCGLGWIAQRDPSHVLAHAAVHLYVGNHEGAWGGYSEVAGLRRTPAGHVRDARAVAEAAAGEPLTASGVALYWAGRAVEFARREPRDAAALIGRKIALLASPYEVPGDESFQHWQSVVPVLRWLPGFGLLLPLAVAGGLAAGLRPGPPRMLLAAALAYGAGLAVFFVTARYRAPLAVFLWPLAGGFAAELLRGARGRQWRRALAQCSGLAAAWALVHLADVPAAVRQADLASAAARAGYCAEIAERAAARAASAKDAPPRPTVDRAERRSDSGSRPRAMRSPTSTPSRPP